MTEIWAVQMQRDLTPAQERFAKKLLPAERLARLESAKREAEPLCAYAALRLALWKVGGLRELPQFAMTDSGKPFFPEFPQIFFNLSHTDGAVLTGVSPWELGVDIEKIRPMKAAAMRRLSNETEPDAFFQSWVRREAIAKRDGSGFRSLMEKKCPEDALYRALETFPGYTAGAAMCGSAEFMLHCCTAAELLEELAGIL